MTANPYTKIGWHNHGQAWNEGWNDAIETVRKRWKFDDNSVQAIALEALLKDDDMTVEYECRYCHKRFKPLTEEELNKLAFLHTFGLCLILPPEETK